MAPQPPVDLQAVIDMLISDMNGKGGTSAANLNLLGNDIFGAVTGTSNDKPLLTQEEAIAQYQPTLANILSTGDANSVEYNLADLIAQGVPVVTIKREILKSITDGTIPPEEEDIMMSFVDTLDKEQRSYQEYLRKPVEDSFTKMGLPAKTERYNPVDIAPEVFQSMLSKMDTAQKGVNERIAKINASSADPTVYEQPKVKGKQSIGSKATQTGLLTLAGGAPAVLGRQIVSGIKDYRNDDDKNLEQLNESALRLVGSQFGLSKKQIEEGKGPQAVAARRALQMRMSDNTKQIADKAPKVDKRATAFNKAQIDYRKELAGAAAPAPRKINVGNSQGDMYSNPVNLRDPVAAQQRVMELTAAKIAAGLEKMNYTPGNIAMIQKLIAAKGMQ
jgi:hypothetical protein